MKVVVASRNRHKLVEIETLLSGLGWTLVTIDKVAPHAVLNEDEDTFEGNALAKARQAMAATGLPALADDSGLEVDALDGAPGVYSARYAGVPCDDVANNRKLMGAMAALPAAPRTARYRCVAAFVPSPAQAGAGVPEIWRSGACEGEILSTPRGTGGFGYDPLFFLPDLNRTMAEITIAEKNKRSHRAAAFGALASDLRAKKFGPRNS